MPGGALQGGAFTGRALAAHAGALRVSSPLEHGRVVSWGDAELVWRAAYGTPGAASGAAPCGGGGGVDGPALGVAPEAHPLLLTEAVHTPRPQRERAAEVLFEALRVPALACVPAPVLALYASGRVTGAVVDVGEGVASVTPVYEGYALPAAVARADFGGRDVTSHLGNLLAKAGAGLGAGGVAAGGGGGGAGGGALRLRAVKEALVYVAAAPAAEEAAVLARAWAGGATYTLPDGSALALGPERFRAGEVLFHPALAGVDAPGVGELLAGALGRADAELRPALRGAVVLSGGATKTPGFGARLLAEARRAAPPGAKTRVFALAERELLPWLGGSILGSLATFSRLAVTKGQWAEEGPNAVHKNAL